MVLGFIASRIRYENVTVKIDKRSFKLMKADTFIKRAIGLMYRKSIPKDGGMLFILKRASRQGIWMKNMKFPIDIIWVDGDMSVCDITHSAELCHRINCKIYRPRRSAKFVLELKSGSCKRFKIKTASKVEIETANK